MNVDRLYDPQPFADATGLDLKSLEETLAEDPATVQDRLHARSYFAVPVLQALIGLGWLLSGSSAILSGFGANGIPSILLGLMSAGLGVLFLLSRPLRRAGSAMIALTVLTLILPNSWALAVPLASMVPAMANMVAAILVVMAFAEPR